MPLVPRLWYMACPLHVGGRRCCVPADTEDQERGVKKRKDRSTARNMPAGIVIRGRPTAAEKPRISAFIWGGKVRPVPTLPYGRWKPTAA